MTRTASWRRLSPARRRALPRAFVAVALVRAALRLVPLPVWESVARRLEARAAVRGTVGVTAGDVAWAVSRVSRIVPGASCLTRALAARLLLALSGHRSELKIGVARAGGGRLRAHAWLESADGIVIGGARRGEYTPLGGASTAPQER